MRPAPAPGPWNEEREKSARRLNRFENVMLVIVSCGVLAITVISFMIGIKWGHSNGH